MNCEYENLGKYLKEKRLQAKYTQASLAEKLNGMHNQFISNWERGLCAPPSHSLDNLIKVLKLNRSELMDAMMADQELSIKKFIYKKQNSK